MELLEMTIGLSKKRGAVALIIVLFAIGSLALAFNRPTGMEGVRVAVYNGRGVLLSSATALFSMFQWMHAEVNYVNATDIQQNVLDGYDIVVFPGGDASEYSLFLGANGRNAVKDFVSAGGSYFGICGGSIFGTNQYLGLFNGYATGAVNGSGTKLLQMIVNVNSTGPDLSDEPSTYDVLYWNSGSFYSNNETYMSTVIPIALFPQNNGSGMLCCKYGNGTVFLSFPHPEYEEGSARDGTTQFDYLNDPDSEWTLLMKVSLWLVESSK
jgi:glutamine amidotransferase-like uncharacterized protein